MDSTINVANPDIFKKLKYSEVIPKSKHDFRKFVNNLIEEPISTSVIDEVWSQIYGSESSVLCNEHEQDLPHASNTPVNSECNGGNSDNDCLSDARNSKRKKIRNIQTSKKCNESDSSDSSDCEIVEVLPLNKSSCGNLLDSVSDNKTYDSDSSIEVLEHSVNSNVDKGSDGTLCHLHNRSIHMSSYVNYKDSFCEIENSSNQFSHTQFKLYEESITSIVHNFNQRHKEMEYEQLRTEVKTLKSLLIGLITHVSNKKPNNIANISSNEPNTGDTVDSPSPKVIEESVESDHLMVCNKKHPIKCSSVSSTCNSKIASNLSNVEQVGVSNSSEKSKKTAKHCVKPQNSHGFDYNLNLSESETSIEDKKRRKKFKWREVIVEVLNSRISKQLPVEKLKRKVIAKYYYYRGNISKNTPDKFYRYLQSTSRVVVNEKRAKYIEENDVTSTREKKNEIITKTVTTTRKYMVS